MVKKEILNSLKKATKEKEIPLNLTDIAHGDFATSVAFNIAKKKSQSAEKIANDLVDTLSKDNNLKKYISKIEIAGGGFVNFFLSKDYLIDNLKSILSSQNYGATSENKGKKIMVEYAHPNTHKEMHIGHMRTLILGESLARIFEKTRALVFRANYQGDIGPHVAKAIWGVQKLLKEKNISLKDLKSNSDSKKAHFLGQAYALGSELYKDNKSEIDLLNSKIYSKDKEVMPLYELTREWSLKYFDALYSRFGTHFDKLYFESQVADQGKEIVTKNINRVFEKSEGAVIFNGEKYALHKRVFITKDGNPTYEGKDMGLAFTQFKDFEFDKNIHIVASEQASYFKVIIKALSLIDPKFEGRQYHLSMGMVSLVGKKMSSRTGEVLTIDELLKEVKNEIKALVKKEDLSKEEFEEISEKAAIAAVKYSVLKTSPTQNVVFDIKRSISLEGDSGPYLQYTIARIKSILRKAKNKDKEFKKVKLNAQQKHLMRKLSQFSEIITNAAKNYSPNLICSYLFDLAQTYNSFYSKEKIIGASQEDFNLSLSRAVSDVLTSGLFLLGIEAPEKM